MENRRNNHEVTVRAVGGPTAVIEIGGLRLLTDPTFSPPGEYRSSTGSVLVKTAGPGMSPEQVGPVDAVLLSHDQHPDNLDDAGREVLATVPLVLTTPPGAARLGEPALPLAPWEHHDLGDTLRVTAVPAQHGPEGCERFTGVVTGFVLSGPGLPSVYVSGDNASVDVVREVARRCGPIDTAVLFLGAARSPALFDGALLTLDSALGTEATRILEARRVVPVHFEQWRHFTEGAEPIAAAFAAAGLGERLRLLRPAEFVTG
jgi:L-ascorbate metabolism protein UlaG (beta-lactamase superfamily)